MDAIATFYPILVQEVLKSIKISRAQRGKKKMVTVIVGMKTFSKFLYNELAH